MKYVKIGSIKTGIGKRAFIIAEAGVNHNGSFILAKKMVDVAKSCGADAVKFQTFRTEDIVAMGQGTKLQFKMFKRLELNEKDFKSLKAYCDKKKIIFLSTPFDSRSASFLRRLGVPAFKIASGELTNIPFLLQIAGYGRPIILSTGMATLKEVKQAIKVIYSTGNKKLILLHCTSNYPAKYRDINLKAMDTLNREFNVIVGYSDHTEGAEVSVAAVAKGAKVIEKHFTLDRAFSGPDHKASMEPDEFKNFISSIRNVEKAMGNSVKAPCRSEEKVKRIVRKSIVAARDIPKGSNLTPEMLLIKRPGTGIEPKHINRLIGKKVKTSIKRDTVLTKGVLA